MPTREAEPLRKLPDGQVRYEALIRDATFQLEAAANQLARTQTLEHRDSAILREATVGGRIEGWSGVITGIAQMADGAGLSVDIGNSRIVAGVHLGEGLDTLISKSDPLFNELIALREGDKIVVSGSFAMKDGAAVEMSYSSLDSANSPTFLFDFESVDQIIEK